MKLLSALFLLLFTIGCSEKSKPSLDELSTTIEEFNAAFEIGDTTKLESMITENYVHTNSSWKSFGKEKWLSYMKSRREKLEKGLIRVSEYKMEEYSVELFENTALVTAKIISRGVENDEPFDKSFRVTNLWVFQDHQWKRAAFHDTLIQ